MIPVLVAASSLVARAGLKSMVEEVAECHVVGSAGSADLMERALDLHPQIVLWQLAPDEDAAPALQSLGPIPVVLLTDQSAWDLVRAGARGVLPWNASPEQIGAALRAAAVDLVVMTPAGHAPVERDSSTLTAREREVLRMVSEGLANKEIAYRLGISDHTVKFHVSSLLGKLGASTRAEAIRVGIRQGAILV